MSVRRMSVHLVLSMVLAYVPSTLPAEEFLRGHRGHGVKDVGVCGQSFVVRIVQKETVSTAKAPRVLCRISHLVFADLVARVRMNGVL